MLATAADIIHCIHQVATHFIQYMVPVLTRVPPPNDISIIVTITQSERVGMGQDRILPNGHHSLADLLTGLACVSSRVVSTSDCGVRGPGFESHRERLCLSRRPLRYAALGTGCAHIYCGA